VTAEQLIAQHLFETLAAEQLRQPGVARRRMFGLDGLDVSGTCFAFLNRERLVVKLPAVMTAALLATGQARIATDLSPTMRKWVSAPLPTGGRSEPWRDLLTEARALAASRPRP